MGSSSFTCFIGSICLVFLFICDDCTASIQSFGKIYPPYGGSQMNWIDKNGLFLISNNSNFAFGFQATQDVTLYMLCIIHLKTLNPVWSANRNSPVSNSDKFLFGDDGTVSLQKGGKPIWSPITSGKKVSAIELQDSGNLVMLGDENSVLWQSFSHPTDTLLSNQEFREGMKLVSDPSPNNLTYVLEIRSGDMILSAGYKTPQPYWSVKNDNRKTINEDGGTVNLASLNGNSWRFYDRNNVLLWQFIFAGADNKSRNATWIAVIGNDGFISFNNLDNGGNAAPEKIPSDVCSRPESCDAYYVCSDNNVCQCPSSLGPNCKTGIVSSCDSSQSSTELVSGGNGLDYFALGFVPPSSKTDFEGCKLSCSKNCSCVALFFQNSTGNCFLFDRVGSLKNSGPSSSFVTYIKVSSHGGGSGSSNGASESSKKGFPYVVIIIIATVLVICGLLYVAFRYHSYKKRYPESPHDSSEDDNFLESLSGMPLRYSYRDLQTATNNFSVKLGQGGFGSVYQGVLPDKTRLAVKKLEGIGQGKKEFRAEVSIIGSIHHHHLVRLKGFCAEGTHRMLAYEFMANGSLDKWIFKRNKEEPLLEWETRFNIALGTAKGLAYLHEDCDVKIIHCDIKPENVLLDDNFIAKVSDFGLAKLMTREQSHVFTTMRGTRGYLAPEWITNYAISEKSDVYSYGMLLLEIISGRKNFVATESSETSYFPSYAFKMMEEGKLRDILDSELNLDDTDKRVSNSIKVALWCIQEDMYLRPTMSKVVQMLEGLCVVSQPPTSSPLGYRLFSSFLKATSEEGTSSGTSDCNSLAYLSSVQLSGPR
ncbi:G-type lectin S-receptor-like serine/threonine-protein kinase SD2-5 [Mercurialis annua]|uniref:G-type lectin S-receptor-like serine/threonine-protein kinase SD2-5 n=1 Tax=Mercurialis annua TaxID=3986 RepID=UPI00215E941F|nr:G-type lectin S-receptor-like serine/threonine-protein kinase SD2-5 [Mercurialis annua]